MGDPIRAKRLNLGIQMQEAAKLIGVHQATLKNWEHKYVEEPAIQHWPKITRFLGYCPYIPCATLPDKVLMYRKMKGISIEQMAGIVGIDPGTLGRFERGKLVLNASRDAISMACAPLFGNG